MLTLYTGAPEGVYLNRLMQKGVLYGGVTAGMLPYRSPAYMGSTIGLGSSYIPSTTNPIAIRGERQWRDSFNANKKAPNRSQVPVAKLVALSCGL